MFKFARYFFLGFLITTVIPLVLMFFWTHHQMESFMHKNGHHLNNMGIGQLKTSASQYLKIQEGNILEQFGGTSPQEKSLHQLKDIFKSDKVEQIYGKNINQVTSYYEVIKANPSSKPVLFSVCVLPVKNSKVKGFKIIKKVDINKLRPNGPFNLEIIFGNESDTNSYREVITDPFMPQEMKPSFHPECPPPRDFSNGGMPPRGPAPYDFSQRKFPDEKKDINFKPDALNLTDNDGKTVAKLLLLPAMHHPPFGPMRPFDNLFGLVILLAGISMSLLTGIYINDNFVKPLMAISDASKKVRKGDLSAELSTTSKQTYILDTYNNFNEMIKGLKDKEKLRKSFISNLTHDLRTPLIAQEKSLELISNKFEQLDLKNEFELAKSLERNNRHLLRMVNLILESYSFDGANLSLTFAKTDIFELIDGCYKQLKPLIQEKDVQFINEIQKDFPTIDADLTSLKRIFLNLISNSVENIQKGGSIKVSAERYENSIEIYVEDNGNGISEEDLSLIFDRFYSGKSFDRKLGSGLGLDVCKKLIELHKGEIKVESKLNEYTKFTINLPTRFEGDKP